MSKKVNVADKSPKIPSLKDAAQRLATARKRIADIRVAEEKAIEQLQAAIHETLNAGGELAEAEAAFEELAVDAARKRYGVEEETPEIHCIGVTFSGICPLSGMAFYGTGEGVPIPLASPNVQSILKNVNGSGGTATISVPK